MPQTSSFTRTGWPKWTWKTSSWLISDSSGSCWAATVASYCPGRTVKHPQFNSTGGFPCPLTVRYVHNRGGGDTNHNSRIFFLESLTLSSVIKVSRFWKKAKQSKATWVCDWMCECGLESRARMKKWWAHLATREDFSCRVGLCSWVLLAFTLRSDSVWVCSACRFWRVGAVSSQDFKI